jgi:hypothetical protein
LVGVTAGQYPRPSDGESVEVYSYIVKEGDVFLVEVVGVASDVSVGRICGREAIKGGFA